MLKGISSSGGFQGDTCTTSHSKFASIFSDPLKPYTLLVVPHECVCLPHTTKLSHQTQQLQKALFKANTSEGTPSLPTPCVPSRLHASSKLCVVTGRSV